MSFVNSAIFDITSGSSVSTTYSAGAGSNRIVGILLSHEQSNTTRPLTAVSLGGANATYLGAVNNGTSGTSYVEFWYILEANISSIGSNPTMSATITAGGSNIVSGLIFTADNVDQTAANWTTGSAVGYADAAVSGSLTTASGWLVVGGMTASNGGSGFTISAPASSEITSPATDRNFNGTTSRTVNFQATASGTSTTITGDSGLTTASVSQVIYAVGLPTAPSGPTISSLGDSTPNYQGSTTITGTGLPTAITGAAGASLGGVAQTLTPNTSTNCSIASISRGNLAYGNYNLTVTDAAGNTSANYATSLSPQAGWKSITTSGTLADPSLRLTTTPVDIVSGNQISVGNVVGGTIDDITLYVDGSYSCAASVISFDYEVHDGTEWGAVGTEYPSTPAGRRGLIRSLARPLARSLVEALTN